MVFSSPLFLFIFLPATLLIYFLLKNISQKNLFLLIASLAFYAWGEGRFFLVMVMSIAMNYIWGIVINDQQDARKKKLLLGIAISINLFILAHYKYTTFLAENINSLTSTWGTLPIHVPQYYLPAGISFFTFHALSYLIDVYRGHFHAQRNPINLGLYISFFPQLIAGPIVRYEYIGNDIENRETRLDDFHIGTKRFIVGLGKKVLLADSIAPIANKIFELPINDLNTPLAWVGAIAYSFQIYFDFSGYSDMAIGMARMFGFRFPENFNYPYVSKSITEFWRRWHISLSSWFRDYLYIPLGGNRTGAQRQYFNLFTVFFLCGLWHGASWNFVIWGLVHGCLLVIEKATPANFKDIWPVFVRRIYTLFAVLISWILFRSENLTHTSGYLTRLLGLSQGPGKMAPLEHLMTPFIWFIFFVSLFAATPILNTVISSNNSNKYREVLVTAFLMFIFMISLVQIAGNTFSPFIYYRF